MKVVILICLVLFIAVTAGLFAIWTHLGQTGTTDLEQWIGKQVISIVENHITPSPDIQSIDYQAPSTAIVENVTLTAENQLIMSVNRMVLELSEIPKYGEPIQIQRIELDNPCLRLITTPTGDFVGWSGFVRSAVKEDLDTVPQGQRLSDVLVLRQVTIRNGQLIYDDSDESTEPMILPGINVTLNTSPLPDDPGWYKLAGSFKRDPLFYVNILGRINLDTALLDLDHLDLSAGLNEQQYSTLPPQIQSVLREHEVQGQLNINMKGRIPLKEPALTTGHIQTKLVNAKAVFGKAVLPVERFNLSADLANKTANVKYEIELLGGQTLGRASLELDKPYAFTFDWFINNVKLENAVRVVKEKSEYAGRMTSRGRLSARLINLPSSLTGSGKVQINRGRLVNLPVIKQLVMLIAKVRSGLDISPDDEANVIFKLHSNHVDITKLEIKSSLFSLRGIGKIFYNNQLDLEVNTSFPKQLRNAMGKLGNLLETLDNISDKALIYTVKGTLDDPQISAKPNILGN